METVKSKIEGINVVPLRCEICYGSIETHQGITPLVKDGNIHFVHSSCYDENEPAEIIKKMDEMKGKTQNDQKIYRDLEESSVE